MYNSLSFQGFQIFEKKWQLFSSTTRTASVIANTYNSKCLYELAVRHRCAQVRRMHRWTTAGH